MVENAGFDYAGFKHIGLIGLGRSGTHAGMRLGINRYKGRSQKWFLHNVDPLPQALKKLETGEMDCDIVIGHVHDPETARRLDALDLPVLDMRGDFTKGWANTHQFDWEAVGRMAAEQFSTSGHRHFTFFCYNADTLCNRLIWSGFRKRLEGEAVSLCRADRSALKTTFVKPEAVVRPYGKTGIWLTSIPYPSAILLGEDVHGESLSSIAFYNGVSIPEQLSVLGIGNDPMICESCLPSLSSIALPAEKLGYEVARHADRILRGIAMPKLQRLPPERVVERQSTTLSAVEDPVVAKALAIMRREAATRMTLGEMIAQLPVSPRSFHDRFKKVVGRLPKDELFRIRVELARDRLLDTNETVLHIALESGFSNVDSFGRLFRQHTGLTPTQFRKQNKI